MIRSSQIPFNKCRGSGEATQTPWRYAEKDRQPNEAPHMCSPAATIASVALSFSLGGPGRALRGQHSSPFAYRLRTRSGETTVYQAVSHRARTVALTDDGTDTIGYAYRSTHKLYGFKEESCAFSDARPSHCLQAWHWAS